MKGSKIYLIRNLFWQIRSPKNLNDTYQRMEDNRCLANKGWMRDSMFDYISICIHYVLILPSKIPNKNNVHFLSDTDNEYTSLKKTEYIQRTLTKDKLTNRYFKVPIWQQNTTMGHISLKAGEQEVICVEWGTTVFSMVWEGHTGEEGFELGVGWQRFEQSMGRQGTERSRDKFCWYIVSGSQ